MAEADYSIDWSGQCWTVLPARALVHEASRTLIVADLHLGKGDHFRQAGIPVPAATTADTLGRLSNLIHQRDIQTLLVLGDFFHARTGMSDELFDALQRWRARHLDIEAINIRGNHDVKSGDPPDSLGITSIGPSMNRWGIRFQHEPMDDAGPCMAGHLHPGIILRGLAHGRLRLPCFVFGAKCAILPAFGAFTGLSIIDLERGDHVLAIADDQVMDVSAAAGSRDVVRQ